MNITMKHEIEVPAANVTANCSPLVHSARGFGTTYLNTEKIALSQTERTKLVNLITTRDVIKRLAFH